MSIKIYTMTHKSFIAPPDNMYVPLHVGREKAQDLGYLGDHTGDQISNMNCYYGELTGLYWVWKNVHDTDFVGTCHYRRYLIEVKENGEETLFSQKDYEKIFQTYDFVTTKRVKLNFSYYYGYGQNHNIRDLEETGRVIKEIYPSYYPIYLKLVNENETYFGNMFVTRKELYDEYCEWLFNILFHVQKRVFIDDYDDYHKRVFGFISEFLLLVWLKEKKLKVLECKVGMTDEKKETKEMKLKLADFFEKKDIQGAKQYFLQSIEKRPDVLMEASDITGELKLSMQIISTCENEYKIYGKSFLDDFQKFPQLIQYMNRVNSIVEHRMKKVETLEDQIFLENKKVSEIAIEIATRIIRK